MKIIRLSAPVVAALIAAHSASAQTAPPAAPVAAPATTRLSDRIINDPATAWGVYGPGQSNAVLATDGPKGYPATRVTVTIKGANAWDAGAVMPIPKPIAAGDVLYVAMYLRAPEAKDGETVSLPLIGVSSASPPYEMLASTNVAITNQWAQYYATGTAAKALAAGGGQATVHLAGDKHVIDLGPIRVFDFGPGFDTSRLPKNK